MIKKYLILLLFFSLKILAQGEANNWYFGNHAGISFNGSTPIALTDGALFTIEGCSTISDNSGNLLFYSNGIDVWDRLHNVMPNGSGLLGNYSSTQSGIIIPHPGNQDLFYVFSLAAIAEAEGLRYSVVDMSLNGGFGDVTLEKNVLLQTPSTEKISAVKHANGNDIWVVTHEYNSNEYKSYLISDTGLNTTPVISAVGYSPSIIYDSIGYLKLSPDASKLAVIYSHSEVLEILEFNNSTGIVSNPIQLLGFDTGNTDTSRIYGLEFSPNNQFLYISETVDGIFQFDLSDFNQTDILNSKTQIIPDYLPAIDEPHQALQLGPDGKIYIAHLDYNYLGVINNPNIQGNGCNYQFDGVFLNTGVSQIGLPPFIQSYFYVGFEAEFLCFGETTQFNANISSAYDSLLWDFGDGTTSTLENPIHNFAAPGDYDVTLAVTVGTETNTEDRTITIYEQPTATQPQDIIICDDNNDGIFTYDLTQQDTAILNGLDAAQFEVVYYNSLVNYNNNVSIANPNAFTNVVPYIQQTIYAKVRNVDQITCEDVTSFTFQVLDSPNPSLSVPNIQICDNTSYGTDTDGIVLLDVTQNETSILNGQSPTEYTINYYTDAGLTNTITNPTSYQNTNPTETIYVEVVSNSNPNCVAQTNFTIEVFDLPTISSPVLLSQCDDNLDGFSAFNLNEVINEITANSAIETITFYPSQTDAINQTNQIVNPETYINQTASTDTVWAYVENINGCFRVSEVQLNVSTTQIPSTFIRDIYKCDDNTDGDAYNGYTTFNFSNIDNEIQTLFPVGQQLTISYYETLADALSETNEIADISNYTNSTPTIQDIYIRVDSTVNNDCLGLGMHLTLHVEDIPLEINPITLTLCDEFNDGIESFDTSSINMQLVQGQANIDVTFIDEDGNTLPSPLPNPFTTDQQTINVVLTNNLSQDPSGACEITSTIDFVIGAGVIANSVSDFNVCDDNNDGVYDFDTSTVEQTVLNGQSDVLVFYYDELGNTLPSPLPNPFTTSTQTVTVRVENSTSAICYDETEINFIVNEQPIANTVADDFICDDVFNDGEAIFDLSSYNNQLLNGQLASIFNVSYHLSQTEADLNTNSLPNNYTCSTTSETIFVRIENVNNTSCYDTTSFQIGVNYLPIANQPDDLSVCDDETNDGIEIFDLNSQNIMILNGQLVSDYNITFHLSQDEADQGQNAITSNFENTENPQEIYARLENNNNPNCFSITTFNLIVNEQPVLTMEDLWSICEGDSIVVEADSSYDQYLWSTGETTSSIVVTVAGDYWVTANNTYNGLECATTKNITVTNSNIATITAVITEDWSQNNNSIVVEVEGDGDYEYSLDGYNYQDSNIFTNLEVGDYTIYVNDKKGCGIANEDVYLMYYPSFFTPNGDSINETWQIINSEKEPKNVIHIFDRYGKLLKQISPQSEGWDGTYNGQPMPTNDYWFVLYRENGKTYRGHFTLKR